MEAFLSGMSTETILEVNALSVLWLWPEVVASECSILGVPPMVRNTRLRLIREMQNSIRMPILIGAGRIWVRIANLHTKEDFQGIRDMIYCNIVSSY